MSGLAANPACVTDPSRPITPLPAVLWSAAFVLAVTQRPVGSGNQSTKFVHALASLGEGELHRDWMASTTSAFPAFNALVRLTYGLLTPTMFVVYAVAAFAVLLWSLVAIARGVHESDAPEWALPAAITIACSAVVGWVTSSLAGVDATRILMGGVAQQSLLTHAFEPGSFGVLIVASIAIFLRGRAVGACALLAAAAALHPAHLQIGALIALGYAVVLVRDGRGRTAAWLVPLTLATFVPYAHYLKSSFAPTDTATWEAAQRIVREGRIPHHAQPSVWLDWTVAVQMALLVAAVALARRTALGWIIGVPAALAVALTVAGALGVDPVAAAQPWRVSIVLVPVATVSLLAHLSARIAALPTRGRTALSWTIWLALAASVAGGAVLQVRLFGPRAPEHECREVWKFARETRTPRSVYVTPPEWQRFRIETLTPVVVNWKTHPQRDVEVLEWDRRLQLVQDMYAARGAGRVALIEQLREELAITHIVFSTGEAPAESPKLGIAHRDAAYTVFVLAGTPAPTDRDDSRR